MGIFDKIGKMFEKKECDFCGGEIGLLGNRKLEDGNMCKNCAAKLSPWFSDRRNSTVAEIDTQLKAREANRAKVAAFSVTRTLGENTKVLLDEDAAVFMVTSARDLAEANPDVLALADITGCTLEIDDEEREEKRKNNEGQMVSYNPPRYTYYYDFYITIQVNNPFFDQMRFKLNNSRVEIDYQAQQRMRGPSVTRPVGGINRNINNRTANIGRMFGGVGGGFNPENDIDYRRYKEMGEEIRQTLLSARTQARETIAENPVQNVAAAPAAATGGPVTCPYCGATTTPDSKGCCEFCGGSVN